MNQKKRIDQLLYAVIGNGCLTLIVFFMVVLGKAPVHKTVYLSSVKPEMKQQELKAHICEKAFKDFAKNYFDYDLLSRGVIEKLKKKDHEAFKNESIQKVYTQMTSVDVCKVIFKRTADFTGLEAVLSYGGPAGFMATTIKPLNLGVEDVRGKL